MHDLTNIDLEAALFAGRVLEVCLDAGKGEGWRSFSCPVYLKTSDLLDAHASA